MTEPAAGWYHDPAGAGAWRWWDGATWTDHVRPMTDNPVTGPVPTGAVPTGSVQTGPVQTGPVQTSPVQTGPVQTGPVQYQPVPTHAPDFSNVAAAPAPEPEPAPAPAQQVGPSTIPQPGQVAPAPAGGGVPMTPQTPVSDQLYWHSSAAEVVEVPRMPHQTMSGVGARATTHAPSYVRDWNDLGSPNTAGIWLLAAWPILGLGVTVGVRVAMNFAGLTGLVPTIAGSAAGLLLAWAFAAMDSRALGERGYHRPRVAWMLLFPPLAYFIARGKEVRRESKHAWAPELFFIVNLLVVAALVVVVAMFFAAVVLSSLSTTA